MQHFKTITALLGAVAICSSAMAQTRIQTQAVTDTNPFVRVAPESVPAACDVSIGMTASALPLINGSATTVQSGSKVTYLIKLTAKGSGSQDFCFTTLTDSLPKELEIESCEFTVPVFPTKGKCATGLSNNLKHTFSKIYPSLPITMNVVGKVKDSAVCGSALNNTAVLSNGKSAGVKMDFPCMSYTKGLNLTSKGLTSYGIKGSIEAQFGSIKNYYNSIVNPQLGHDLIMTLKSKNGYQHVSNISDASFGMISKGKVINPSKISGGSFSSDVEVVWSFKNGYSNDVNVATPTFFYNINKNVGFLLGEIDVVMSVLQHSNNKKEIIYKDILNYDTDFAHLAASHKQVGVTKSGYTGSATSGTISNWIETYVNYTIKNFATKSEFFDLSTISSNVNFCVTKNGDQLYTNQIDLSVITPGSISVSLAPQGKFGTIFTTKFATKPGDARELISCVLADFTKTSRSCSEQTKASNCAAQFLDLAANGDNPDTNNNNYPLDDGDYLVISK